MRYIKAILIFLLIICLGIFFASCSNNNDEVEELNPEETTLDTDSVAQYLINEIEFQDEMNIIDDDMILDILDVDSEDVNDICAYESTGATAEEIIVIKSDDEKSAKNIKSALKERVQSQISGFENYDPDELDKLEKAIISQVDDLIILIVCEDDSRANDLLKEKDKWSLAV